LHVHCVGLDYRSAPVEVRESVALSGERLRNALASICAFAGVNQAVILSTCNRTEIYTASPRDVGGLVRQWLITQSHMGAHALDPCVYQFAGLDVVSHLCRVAAGVESQVVGESEILGQIKVAVNAARSAGTLWPELERMFLAAVRCGKRAHSETAIGRGAFSIGRCAVETAKSVFGSLQGRTILILGAGKIAETTARHLHSQGADTILVANRTFSRAQELARELDGRALRYDQLPEGLVAADIVITSTSAPHFVLLPEHIEEAMARRNGRDIFLIDIAVPRDIDPRAADIPGAHVCDIDDLDCGVRSAEEGRADEAAAARKIASDCAQEFCEWLAAREAVPMLASLRNHFEVVRQEQISRFAAKIERLSSSDRELVEAITKSLVKRLLHEPTVNLKHELAIRNGMVVGLLQRLYGLERPAGESPRSPSAGREVAREAPAFGGLPPAESPGDDEGDMKAGEAMAPAGALPGPGVGLQRNGAGDKERSA